MARDSRMRGDASRKVVKGSEEWEEWWRDEN